MEYTIPDKLRLLERYKLADKFDAALAEFIKGGDRKDLLALLDVWLEAKQVLSEPAHPWLPPDPRWQEHTPGHPMPCDPDTLVHVLVREDRWPKTWSESEAHPAKHWDWRLGARWLNWGLGSYRAECRAIVAWRPA